MDRPKRSAANSKIAEDRAATPACTVEMRYLYQVLRAMPPGSVFAQILLGFEVAAADLASPHAHYLGINLVQPEDAILAMTDYRLHMQMIDALHKLYPKVHITLHAGEIALGLVPPEGLSSTSARPSRSWQRRAHRPRRRRDGRRPPLRSAQRDGRQAHHG